MKIISTFLQAQATEVMGGRPTILFAFDTLVDDKRLVVGVTVGVVQGPDLNQVRVSAVGQMVIDVCGRHMASNYPQGAVVVAGVAQVANAPSRIRQVLAQAPDGAMVLLVCANPKVYDATTPALGIDLQSANQRPH